MRPLFCLMVALLYAPPVLAQAPAGLKIAGNAAYPAHSLVRLRAEGQDAKAGLLWRVYPSIGVQRATTARNLMEFAAPPGSYEVELLAVAAGPEGELKVEEARLTVTIGTPEPKPPVPTPPMPGDGKLDPVAALGRIRFGNAGCTATVIGPRRPDGKWDVLTAAHCVAGEGARGTMTLKDGRSLAIRVVGHYKTPDLAWCVTEEAVADLPYAKLAPKNPEPSTAIWHMGYGVDKPGNREDGVVSAAENGDGQLRMSLSVSSGDSGGGIFRADSNELISVVCCTSGLGRTTAMWGGSADAARRTRPKAAEADAAWLPVPMPLRIEPKLPLDDGHWQWPPG